MVCVIPLTTATVFLGFLLPWMWGLHGCSSKAQPLLFTLEEGYLLTASPPDLELGVVPLGPPASAQPPLLGCGALNVGLLFSVTALILAEG